MTAAIVFFNILLGLVYTMYGTMTLLEMARSHQTRGFSHFGAAWIAMAFTCGPHHWAHGIHVIQGSTTVGTLDLVAVLFGLPAGVIWFALRVEAYRGGRGDRHVAGTPGWVMALPTVFGIYLTALVAAAIGLGATIQDPTAGVIANFMLVGLYSAIGYFLARTQLANRRPLGGWSLSGLALAVVFPTCAVMHGIYAFYELNGTYVPDGHMTAIDVLAVPAATYFLWVVHALYRGDFRDCNGAPGTERSDSDEPRGPSPGPTFKRKPQQALPTASLGAEAPLDARMTAGP
jgi:hypothetical protein